jgi:hypothetical protein
MNNKDDKYKKLMSELRKTVKAQALGDSVNMPAQLQCLKEASDDYFNETVWMCALFKSPVLRKIFKGDSCK